MKKNDVFKNVATRAVKLLTRDELSAEIRRSAEQRD